MKFSSTVNTGVQYAPEPLLRNQWSLIVSPSLFLKSMLPSCVATPSSRSTKQKTNIVLITTLVLRGAPQE